MKYLVRFDLEFRIDTTMHEASALAAALVEKVKDELETASKDDDSVVWTTAGYRVRRTLHRMTRRRRADERVAANPGSGEIQ
jgi:hypothetical protein